MQLCTCEWRSGIAERYNRESPLLCTERTYVCIMYLCMYVLYMQVLYMHVCMDGCMYYICMYYACRYVSMSVCMRVCM